MTPAGIEPVAFRFVAEHLNNCATAASDGHIDARNMYRRENKIKTLNVLRSIAPSWLNLYSHCAFIVGCRVKFMFRSGYVSLIYLFL